ncbi:MAG: HAD-IA family hydrolase [Planctomycetota bacterium]
MSAPRALLFDLDGTLIDSAADLAGSANVALESLGREPIPVDQVRRFIGDGLVMLMKRCLGGDDSLLEPALEAFREHYRTHLVVQTVPYRGIPQILDRLNGHPLAVVSNKSESYCRGILEILGWSKYFGSVVGGDTVPEKKPSPEPVRRALNELGVEASEALLIGDGTTDVESGRAAGVTTWAALWGYKPKSALADCGPDAMIETVDQLRERLESHPGLMA